MLVSYRLYLDGRDEYPPKPVVIDMVHTGTSSAEDIPNDADVNFNELLLENMVRYFCFKTDTILPVLLLARAFQYIRS